MIVVTGANGGYGKSAIHALLARGVNPSDIAALVRSEEKGRELKALGLEIRLADYSDYPSLLKAFQGVDKLLFVSGSDIEQRESQHQQVVEAAREAAVKHIVYTSFVRNREVERSHIAFLQQTHYKTENWIKESGIPYTILQNGLYMDMIPMFAGEAVLESGLIMQPAKEGRSSSVLRAELAEVAAYVLTTEGHEDQVYPLSNIESLSYQEIADAISEVSGKSIKYISPSAADYQKEMEKHKVPAEYIGMFTAFSLAQADGELDIRDNTLERLLGRKPTSAKEFFTQVYG